MVKDEVVLQKVQQQNVDLPSASIPWFNTRPLNQRTQVNNVYLDFWFIYWYTNITWTAVGAGTYTAENTDIIPLSIIWDSSWKYPRKITADWWLIIPATWTYAINVSTTFNMPVNTNSKTTADIVAQFGNVALLSFISQADYDWWTKSFVYYESKRFDLTVDNSNYWFTWNLQKWWVLYLQAAHKRDWITFQIISWIYITKIS